MKWALRIVVGLVAVVVLVVLVGWLLPVNHEASRSAQYRQPPAVVYAVVADVEAYPRWFPEITQVEVLASSNGRKRFREHMGSDSIVMEVEEAAPPRRFVTRIADPDQPFGGTWTFEITGERGGTRLTITERGEIYNPIFRFMARFVFGYTSTMDGFLTSLAWKFGETPTF